MFISSSKRIQIISCLKWVECDYVFDEYSTHYDYFFLITKTKSKPILN